MIRDLMQAGIALVLGMLLVLGYDRAVTLLGWR